MDHLGVDAPVEVGDRLAVGLVESPDDDAIGLEEVLDRRPLAQELGVGDVAHAVGAEGAQVGAQAPARADRDGALHDHDPLATAGGDLGDDALHA